MGRIGWPAKLAGVAQLAIARLPVQGPVAQRGMRALGVVMPSPALNEDLRLPQAVEDLASEQLIPQLVWVTPIERTAASMVCPQLRPGHPLASAWQQSPRVSAACLSSAPSEARALT